MEAEGIENSPLNFGHSASASTLNTINNTKWLYSQCFILREKTTRQDDNRGVASGIIPFCVTKEIKNSTQKCTSVNECVEYVLCTEIDVDLFRTIECGEPHDLSMEFRMSDLGSTFSVDREEWNVAMDLVKRENITLEELGRGMIKDPFPLPAANCLLQLNKDLGSLLLSKKEFFEFASSQEIQNSFKYINGKHEDREKRLEKMFKVRGVRAVNSLRDVETFFQLVRTGLQSSAMSRIFAHLVLKRLPSIDILLMFHDIDTVERCR